MGLAFVLGTRPEIVKVVPVLAELHAMRKRPLICMTGQHTELARGMPGAKEFANATSLGLASDGNVVTYLNRARQAAKAWLKKQQKIRYVVVQGDTMSALAGAQAASELDIPVAHIEAGVRSHNLADPWPEEQARVTIDGIADLCLAPTLTAKQNLLAEGVPQGNIRVTGNTCVSSIKRYTDAVPQEESMATILITLHRRELRESGRVRGVLEALMKITHFELMAGVAFWLPMHPAMQQYFKELQLPPNFILTGPLAYKQMVEGLAGVRGVLTDSGGLVEEAATLGVPTAILRYANDRPEAVDAGIARRYNPTPKGVEKAIRALVARDIERKATNCFGNESAAHNVAVELT